MFFIKSFMLKSGYCCKYFSSRLQNRNKTENVYVVIIIILVSFSHIIYCLHTIMSVEFGDNIKCDNDFIYCIF